MKVKIRRLKIESWNFCIAFSECLFIRRANYVWRPQCGRQKYGKCCLIDEALRINGHYEIIQLSTCNFERLTFNFYEEVLWKYEFSTFMRNLFENVKFCYVILFEYSAWNFEMFTCTCQKWGWKKLLKTVTVSSMLSPSIVRCHITINMETDVVFAL